MNDLRSRLRRLSLSPTVQHEAATPSWLVSFGDMMTCILTFFILLCTLAQERQPGNVAAGIGSFIQRLDALGLPGLMPDPREAEVKLQELEQRFARAMQAARAGEDAEGGFDRESEYQRAAHPDEHRDPDHWIPDVAVFDMGRAVLTGDSRRRLEDLVPLLRARSERRVYLEARVPSPETPAHEAAVRRALERVRVVREFLIASGIDGTWLVPRLLAEDNSFEGYSVSLSFEPKE